MRLISTFNFQLSTFFDSHECTDVHVAVILCHEVGKAVLVALQRGAEPVAEAAACVVVYAVSATDTVFLEDAVACKGEDDALYLPGVALELEADAASQFLFGLALLGSALVGDAAALAPAECRGLGFRELLHRASPCRHLAVVVVVGEDASAACHYVLDLDFLCPGEK